MKITTRIVAFGLMMSLGLSAYAGEAEQSAIKARKAQMQLYAFNIGQLGAMAKGSVEYNADAASAAAGNLVKLSSLNAHALWPVGSDNTAEANTRALPSIWAVGSDIGAKAGDLAAAATAMEASAGQGLDALRGAIGPLGSACGACHKAHRGPSN